MNKINYLQAALVFLLQLFATASFSNDAVSKKDLIVIHDKAISLIREYENTINKLGEEISDIEKTKSNIELLIDLYVNRKTLVYNDLDPAHKLSEYYEVETYASNLSLWYPDGQTITMLYDNATASNIINHEENIYSIDVVIPKKISGNYLNTTMNSNQEKLLFRIAFVVENNKPGTFKIAGVRNASGELKHIDNQDIMEVNSASFSKDAVLKIQEYCRNTVNDLTNYLALLGNADETDEDKEFYKEAVYGLFTEDDNAVYNDLETDAGDKYLGIHQYIQDYTTMYPVINNISVNTDSATFSKVIKNNDGSFYINMYANKFFSAKTKGKNIYRFQNKMVVKISFDQNNQSFNNFKIESFDNLGMNEALAASQSQAQDINSFLTISEVSRKGLYISANVNSGFAKMVNKNMAELDLDTDYHEWDIKSDISYGGQIRVTCMFNDFIGAEAGLGYQYYKTTYTISSDNIYAGDEIPDSADLQAFVDGTTYYFNIVDEYKKIIQINLDSIIFTHAISIPLYITSYIGKPGKVCLNLKTGIDINYFISPEYSVTGTAKHFVYYPNTTPSHADNFITVEDYPGQDWGILYNRNINKEKEEFKGLNSLSVIGVLYIGAEIPLGYFMSFNAGVTLKTSLTDLSKNKSDYIDIFGQTENDLSKVPQHVFKHESLKLQQYLIEVGLKYKF